MKEYISRKYNSLSLQNKQFIPCYYDLDTRINKQRGALCKIKYKHNIYRFARKHKWSFC